MKPYQTVVAFGDVHRESKYLDLLLPFLIDSQPDQLIVAGDLFDFAEISEYDRHKRNYIGTAELARKVEAEIQWGIGVMDALDCALPKADKVFIMGNHCARYEKYATYEQAQFHPDDRLLQNRLDLRGRGWKFIDLGGHYRAGKLYFMHGEKINGDLFAKNAAIKFRKNVRLWHHHTNQSYCITSPLDSSDTVEVKAVGCLCEKDPMYMKGLTNRWINSFLVAHILPGGNFQDFTVNIVGDRFVTPDGKLYK